MQFYTDFLCVYPWQPCGKQLLTLLYWNISVEGSKILGILYLPKRGMGREQMGAWVSSNMSETPDLDMRTVNYPASPQNPTDHSS